MAIIPTVKVTDLARAVAFYTGALDFRPWDPKQDLTDPGYAVLLREGDELHLSSHAGDGVPGQSVLILTADVDAVAAAVFGRGHDASGKPDSPIHQGPVDQTWGTRDFAVDDPDGNTIVYVQRP